MSALKASIEAAKKKKASRQPVGAKM